MKKLFIFTFLVYLSVFALALTTSGSDEKFVVQCFKEGNELYSYNFSKALSDRERCESMYKADIFYPLASEIIKIPGIEWVCVERYSVMFVKNRCFHKGKIEKDLIKILGKYLYQKNIVIVDMDQKKE